MRDELLGYLLGALEPDEHQRVEEHLQANPAHRTDVDVLRRATAPLACDQGHHEPPNGLARRTCRMIAAHAQRNTTIDVGSAAGSGWQMRDFLIAASIVFVASLLIFPALQRSRTQALRMGCLHHVGTIGKALGNYSDSFAGMFPTVDASGPFSFAGIYAARLREGGYIDDPAIFLCPEVPHDEPLQLPTLGQIKRARADDARFGVWMIKAGGDYAYLLGYLDEQGQYHAARNLSRSQFPILADRPSTTLTAGTMAGPNHGGLGINVLFEDGRAQWRNVRALSNVGDNCFLNNKGVVAAGIGRDDAVLAPSPVSPVKF